MEILNKKVLPRRTFLKAAGVSLGLPLLDAMCPLVHAAEPAPRRMVLVGRPLGMHAPFLFPEQAGRDFQPTRYLRKLNDHRGHFTVISGISHLGYQDHHSELGLFTGVPWDRIKNPREARNTISLDQEAASHIGDQTRYPYLSLAGRLSWNRRGQELPSENRATTVFRQLFVDGTREEVAREVQRLRDGQSILDNVRDQARSLSADVGAADRARLDLFFSSVREAEQHLHQNMAWAARPKPRVTAKPPTADLNQSGQMIQCQRQWYDLIHLAVQTDSTRVISFKAPTIGNTGVFGVSLEHHDASHHGRDETKIEQLARIEEAEMEAFAEFVGKLRASREGDATLLDRSMVLFASNLGNASAHSSNNLPVVLAGGGFRHVGHLAFDRQNNRPLSNLFLRMLHQLGAEANTFGGSTGVLSDLS